MQRLDTIHDLRAAVEHLARLEPRFALVADRHGLPPLRHADPSLGTLLRIVTDQLISLKAGEAIWARLASRFGDFLPGDILAAAPGELRLLGLSTAKARTFHAAARAFGSGILPGPEGLPSSEVERRLLEIPGVGPWTANIYLLMALRAVDAWPAADLALQVAAQDLLGLAERPSTRRLMELGEGWRPYRSVAALLLWGHYRGLRGMPAG